MTDQTSDPVQDAGLASSPIQGVDEGVVKSGDDESAHVPITTAPEEVQQDQETQETSTEQQSDQTSSSRTDQSAGGIITDELIQDTGQQMNTPIDQSNDSSDASTTEQPYPGTATDATGDKSSDLA